MEASDGTNRGKRKRFALFCEHISQRVAERVVLLSDHKRCARLVGVGELDTWQYMRDIMANEFDFVSAVTRCGAQVDH